MKIDPSLLRDLRKSKGFTLNQLADRSGVSKRTIQRLEKSPSPSESSRTSHENTLNRLAKALLVSPDVLTGESPPPESDKTSASDIDTKRTQIGALIAPKVRLAYDLVKRRYGVSITEIINMAPLFFVLLAEGSLAWRSKKLQEGSELISALEKGQAEFGHGIFRYAVVNGENEAWEEEQSISKADLFGEHLFSEDSTLYEPSFDSSKENPFANYLRKLADDLDSPGTVDTEHDGLGSFGSAWLRFPYYDVCRDELNSITGSSSNARRPLETGYVRLSEIPKELMEEDAGEERAEWLESKLPDIYRDLDPEEPMADLARFEETATPLEREMLIKGLERERASRKTEHETGEGDSS